MADEEGPEKEVKVDCICMLPLLLPYTKKSNLCSIFE